VGDTFAREQDLLIREECNRALLLVSLGRRRMRKNRKKKKKKKDKGKEKRAE